MIYIYIFNRDLHDNDIEVLPPIIQNLSQLEEL